MISITIIDFIVPLSKNYRQKKITKKKPVKRIKEKTLIRGKFKTRNAHRKIWMSRIIKNQNKTEFKHSSLWLFISSSNLCSFCIPFFSFRKCWEGGSKWFRISISITNCKIILLLTEHFDVSPDVPSNYIDYLIAYGI